MTLWKKRRQASGLSKTDMANELGLNYKHYNAIEKGDVKMPSNLIDKFNEIINRGKQNELKNVENNIKADEFWNEVKQKNANGKYVLTDKMHEFNIPNMKALVILLGYKSEGTVWNYLQGRNVVGNEFKKRLYTFFSDEKNIQIPTKVVGKTETGKKRRREVTVNKVLDNYYKETDFKKIFKDYNLTGTKVADVLGVHNSTIYNMLNKKNKPSYKILSNVKNYLEEFTKEPVNDVKLPEVPLLYPNVVIPKVDVKDLVPNYFEEEKKTERNSVIERYENELEEIDNVIAMYNNKIKDLEFRKKVCVEVLNVIEELTTIKE